MLNQKFGCPILRVGVAAETLDAASSRRVLAVSVVMGIYSQLVVIVAASMIVRI